MIYIAITLFSFILALFFVPLNKKLSYLIGSIDRPIARSAHTEETPKSGGISILLSISITIFLLVIFKQFAFNKLLFGLLIGSILVVLLGVIDDLKDINPWQKVIIEIIIALIVYYCGFRIDLVTNPFGSPVDIGIFSLPVTVLWFILIMNSINLIDGLDGLATGIVAIVSVVLGLSGIWCNNTIVAYISFSLVGACLGFLKYNFYPATIFLGDAGSLFLGFLIASLSVAGNAQFKGATALTLLIPIIVLSFPLIDTVHAVFRRLKTPDSIFRADKKHLHHKMLELGFPYKTVVYIGYFLTCLFGLIAVGFLLLDRKILFSIIVITGIIFFVIFYQIIKREI